MLVKTQKIWSFTVPTIRFPCYPVHASTMLQATVLDAKLFCMFHCSSCYYWVILLLGSLHIIWRLTINHVTLEHEVPTPPSISFYALCFLFHQSRPESWTMNMDTYNKTNCRTSQACEIFYFFVHVWYSARKLCTRYISNLYSIMICYNFTIKVSSRSHCSKLNAINSWSVNCRN